MGQQGKLAGKVAIVTGAGSSGPGLGTGKAMSVLFAREGARVVLVDKFTDRAAETLAMIEAEGGEAIVVPADLADLASAPAIVADATTAFGGVDILVNNAAVAPSTGILNTSVELYAEVLAVNLTAPFCCRRRRSPR